MAPLDFDVALQPKQRELLTLVENSPATVIGYGGARGGAKSHGGRDVMLLRRWKYANTPGLIIRRTLDDLRDNHIRPLLRQYPQLERYYKKQEKILELPNGSYVRFISSDNYDDIFNLVGKEFADIFVDQSEQFTQEQLEFVGTINRSTSLEITPKIWWTFNPGDVGHGYHKRIFIEKDFQPHENAETFAFIRAYGWDNVEWVRKALKLDRITVTEFYTWDSDRRFNYFVQNSDYGRKLNQLPDSQRKAQLFGDFDVFEGQFLSMWRRELHVIAPMIPPAEWPRLGVIDYGERTVLEVGARDYEGRVITFAECYTEAMSPSERFNAMADMLIEKGLDRLEIQYDTNMDLNLKNYTGYDKTQAEIAYEVFKQRMGTEKMPFLHVVSKATTDRRGYRVVCNEAVKEFLSWTKDKDGAYTRRPKLYVTSECKHLIKTAPLLLHDPESVDGLDFIQKNVVDDPYDAWKMMLMALMKPLPKREEDKPFTSQRDFVKRTIMDKIIERNQLGKVSADTI